ncbi:MAG: hypothetical protein L0H23_05290 [Luteimonas sp.]|nr:hypothetical protein [Luteimonas sp.]
MQKKLMGAMAMAAIATLAASGAATAAQPASRAKLTTGTYQGVQVAIDPVTGRLRAPTAAERKALGKVLLAPSTGSVAGQRPRTEAEARSTLKVKRKGRIGMSMQVPETQFNYLTAERNADGSISIHHEGDGDGAVRAQEVTQ